jgi:ABC-type polysaccharide/polyol phosphate transport system ATPase subunit
MSEIAIRIDSLSKRYRLGALQRQKYRTLRDVLTTAATHPFRLRRERRESQNGAGAGRPNTVWALKGISCEVRRGEAVGVIGRNGAGKSTLLKILSRITEPTEGYAEIHGSVGSLLEVGTGFHPELTGRENIYLNGAILGMRRAEIERRFDEIVAFAEIEKFIDTAVKHYSSGMYLKLAFAVAAHMEPDIVMLDEVLAVGDAAFQKKCIGKMNEIVTQGRTIFFVSHNLGAVKELCTSTILLSNGTLDFQGSVSEGIARYSRGASAEPGDEFRGDGWRRVHVADGGSGLVPQVVAGREIVVHGTIDLTDFFPTAQVLLLIENAVGDMIVHQQTTFRKLEAGTHEVTVRVPPLPLAPGVFTVYFKFIGPNAAGFLNRHVSERGVFEIHGSIQGISRAVLAPCCEWAMTAHTAAVFSPTV